MPSLKTEFLILGSGFGGSLLALILARAGRSVALVDRSRHPRFAIGESSTPLADRTLAQVVDRFELPELRALCHWGSWKQMVPHVLCGKKRGFTYFDQTTAEDLTVSNFDDRRLLVSASVDDEHSDTHWLRCDVDQFVFGLAISSGAKSFEQCEYTLRQEDSQWVLEGHADPERKTIKISATFLIDATGSPNGVLKFLGVSDQTPLLKTNSRSIFAHFASVKTCEQLLRDSAIDVSSFPYCCDDAAVHQVVSDGWMWQLRFDDDSLSAGFMIDERTGTNRVAQAFATPLQEWDWRIARSPFLSRQFTGSTILRPKSGLQSTKRIQRLAGQGAGSNWAAITNTVGFIDPLHSTGIAHTLFGVSRLATILLTSNTSLDRQKQLREYSTTLIEEIRCVDELVEGCYEAIPSFRLWCLWGMLYFAAATSMEQTSETEGGDVSFLRSNDPAFREMLREARQRLGNACRVDVRGRASAEDDFEAWLKSAVAPWNHVGLFDDSCNNLYSRTAAPTDAW